MTGAMRGEVNPACTQLLKWLAASLVLSCVVGAAKAQSSSGSLDNWLTEALASRVEEAVAAGQYTGLQETIRSALLARIAAGPVNDIPTAVDMVYLWRASEYLPLEAADSNGAELAEHLYKNRELSRRLFRALSERRRTGEAFVNLRQLIEAAPDAVETYPDLAVAFAVAEPFPPHMTPETTASLVECFTYYTDGKHSFRYNLRKMPWELSQYLADSRLSLDERAWAQEVYRRARNPMRSFFDIEYDYDHYRESKPKKITELGFSLQNLHKVGGVCIEQAYFASQVCKSLGVPAVIVTGQGQSDSRHAWVAGLLVSRLGSHAEWDCSTGRHKSHKYYTGKAYEPIQGRHMLDSEMMLLGMAAQLPLQRREAADAALALARLADDQIDPLPGDANVLRDLAEQWHQAHPKEPHPLPEDSMPPTDGLTPQFVRDMALLSIEQNLAYRPAWRFVVSLRKQRRLLDEDLEVFFDRLVEKTAANYPDFSCQMVLEIAPTIEDDKRRETVYKRVAKTYRRRPDLRGALILALADDLRRREKLDAALKQYAMAANEFMEVQLVCLDATDAAESLYRTAGRLDLAAKFYKGLFGKARKYNKADTIPGSQTTYYAIGMRLARVLTDAGDTKSARRVYEAIGASKR